MSRAPTATQTPRRPRRESAPAAFADAMSALATGVVMVTTRLDGRPWGMTVSAFTSVSADPPTVLVSLSSDTASARAIAEAGSFGVSILGRDHCAAARHGAARGAPKFLERFVEPGEDDRAPALDGALAHLECEVVERLDVADHTIFVGRVRDARTHAAASDPLVYFRRAYRLLAQPSDTATTGRNPCPSS